MNDQQQTESTALLPRIKEFFEGRVVTQGRSAAGNWLGFTLEHIEAGKAAMSMTVRPEMTNPFGTLHGGMMGVLVDECMGWAVTALDAAARYTTTGLHIDFLFAAKEGERVRAESHIVRHGKRIIYAECSVFGESGKLIARANSSLIALI